MGTYDTIAKGLQNYAERFGGKANLMRHLDASKATFYRAVEENPTLPKTDVVCDWLDKLHAQIVFPGEELDGFALIPRVKAVSGAGESWEISDEVAGMYAFRESFMRYLGVNAKNAIMMYVEGDSMEPLICNHDTILINTAEHELREGYLYTIAIGETLMVKRLQRIPSGWNICSENPKYPPISIEGQELEKLRVIGRVRWFGRVV